jgi:hypothetical protein
MHRQEALANKLIGSPFSASHVDVARLATDCLKLSFY